MSKTISIIILDDDLKPIRMALEDRLAKLNKMKVNYFHDSRVYIECSLELNKLINLIGYVKIVEHNNREK